MTQTNPEIDFTPRFFRSLLKNQPQVFSSYCQFIADCMAGQLPEYCFVEPCFNDHIGPGGGMVLASGQHPDHNVQPGEVFIANTYNATRSNPELWKSAALLILYYQHGGIYDHVAPPAASMFKDASVGCFFWARYDSNHPIVIREPDSDHGHRKQRVCLFRRAHANTATHFRKPRSIAIQVHHCRFSIGHHLRRRPAWHKSRRRGTLLGTCG
jgi:hypothetical protein